MYFVHTWAQRLLGQDFQEDHIKLDLDLEMTLTVKVKLFNYAKNPISFYEVQNSGPNRLYAPFRLLQDLQGHPILKYHPQT